MNKQTKPLVSIVMCVYNGEEFLQEQIESVLNQTYSNYELLILDDKSTDSSVSIIKAYQVKHNQIQFIQNNTNLGFNKNFEKGILLSKGELISICDQDDIWLPEKIEELTANIGSAKLIYSNSELINEQGDTLKRTLAYKLIHVDNPCFKAFLDSNFITGHTCLFRTELIQDILPLPEKVTYYDKWIGLVASYVGEVKYYNKVLTKYRIHSNSVIQQEKQAEENKTVLKQKRIDEIESFSKMKFVKEIDQNFIKKFLYKKKSAGKGIKQYISCYIFLLKNHTKLYPWYSKSFVKKINFLRKQCH